MPEISVCIPTYEYKGQGVQFLSELFDSLETQTFKDFDVVISDHSVDDEIMNFCRDNDYDLNITYIKNPNGRGYQSPNTNCVLQNAEGKILKLIYQDDIFVSDLALEKIKNAFIQTNCKWLFHGFSHTTDGVETHRDCVPRWCDMMLEGRNLLGSPSCIAILNGCELEMDENIKLLIDTELYHRMRMEFGMPHIIEDILIANREHDIRISTGGIQYDRFIEHPEGGWLINQSELDYVEEKHRIFCRGGRKYPDEN
jgi:glycosyltransferase involved in cell wall biosynthesis